MIPATSQECAIGGILFRGLDALVVRRIAALSEEVPLAANAVLFRQGDAGDALYGVLQGRIRITINIPGADAFELADLEAGELFGEIALLDGQPRSATATAMADTVLVRIPFPPFLALMDREPALSRHFLGLLCARVRSSSSHLMLRRKAEAEARQARAVAEQALADLKQAQHSLVQAEKMAALGALVSGVAHEINTPVGSALTMASHLADRNRALQQRIAAGTLRRQEIATWFQETEDAFALLQGALRSAGDLVHSFKQIAADQTRPARRRFDLRGYLDDVALSLLPSLRQAGHRLEVACPHGIEMDSYPGALCEILTHLTSNALDHAFPEGRHGCVRIAVTRPAPGEVLLQFADDGVGIPPSLQARVFDPFVTTRRGAGRSGLGLHTVYNTVVATLQGQIALEPARPTGESGTTFSLRLPRTVR